MFTGVQLFQGGDICLSEAADGDLAFVKQIHLDDGCGRTSQHWNSLLNGKRLTSTIGLRNDKERDDKTQPGRPDKDERRRRTEVGRVRLIDVRSDQVPRPIEDKVERDRDRLSLCSQTQGRDLVLQCVRRCSSAELLSGDGNVDHDRDGEFPALSLGKVKTAEDRHDGHVDQAVDVVSPEARKNDHLGLTFRTGMPVVVRFC